MPSPTTLCQLDAITWRGLDALLLDNGLVRAVVVPALGGKIASLIHLKTGREWLWRNPHLETRLPEYAGDYVGKYDLGGFDECFPSVAATRYPVSPWEGIPVPDHGEIWGLPWKSETFCDGHQIEVRMSVHGVRFPYRFERVLLMSAGEAGLRLAYSVVNHAPMPFPFIWSAHPIFQVGPGMKLVVPIKEARLYSSLDNRFGTLGERVSWPVMRDRDGREWDFSKMPEQDAGVGLKLWAPAPAMGYVGLQDLMVGAELRLQFDPTEVTQLGMWLNYGGWSGVPGAPAYYNLGLEPCIGAQDDLALAVNQFKEHGVIPASGRRTWHLTIMMR